MVDSIKGVSPVQTGNMQSANKSNNQNNRAEASGSSTISDEVNISSEALSLAEAENTARATRNQLGQNSDATLGRAEALDDFLA